MRVGNEKCKKAAKPKGLSLLETFGISGFSYVANATTEPSGEVALRRKDGRKRRRAHFEISLEMGL